MPHQKCLLKKGYTAVCLRKHPQKLLFRNKSQNVHCIFLQPWGVISKNYASRENMN